MEFYAKQCSWLICIIRDHSIEEVTIIRQIDHYMVLRYSSKEGLIRLEITHVPSNKVRIDSLPKLFINLLDSINELDHYELNFCRLNRLRIHERQLKKIRKKMQRIDTLCYGIREFLFLLASKKQRPDVAKSSYDVDRGFSHDTPFESRITAPIISNLD